MKILILGGGAREHAITKALIRTGTPAADIIVAPGNAGIAQEVRTEPELDASDVLDVVKFALSNQIDLAIVGPEAPLVAGVSDALRSSGVEVFGPSKS